MNQINFIENELKFKLFDWQKNVITAINNNKNIIISHARGVGCTSAICYYISDFLLNNTKENKTIILMGNSYSYTHILNNIRFIINVYLKQKNLKITKNNRLLISLNNGNTVQYVPNIKGKNGIESIFIDNANYLNTKKLEEIINDTIICNANKLILVSSGYTPKATLLNKLIYNHSDFTKITVPWYENELRSPNWLDEQKKYYGTYSSYYHDNLLFSEPNISENTNKQKTISLRIDNDKLMKIYEKINSNNISISEYIRNLIDIDILSK